MSKTDVLWKLKKYLEELCLQNMSDQLFHDPIYLEVTIKEVFEKTAKGLT